MNSTNNRLFFWKSKRLLEHLPSNISDNIRYLLDHPYLASETYHSGPDSGSLNSNCHGTTMFNIQDNIGKRPYFGEREDIITALRDYSFVDESSKLPGDVVAMSGGDRGFYPVHTGIYVGNVFNSPVLFHQRETQGPFEFMTVKEKHASFAYSKIKYLRKNN